MIAFSGSSGIGAVLGGLFVGAVLGGLIGAFARLGAGEAWEDTLIPADSPVVAVTSNDDATLDRAADLLGHQMGCRRIVRAGEVGA